jgi:hypothetical protein
MTWALTDSYCAEPAGEPAAKVWVRPLAWACPAASTCAAAWLKTPPRRVPRSAWPIWPGLPVPSLTWPTQT